MERAAHYRQLIMDFITRLADLATQQSRDGTETLAIFDEKRDHYLLMITGWSQEQRVQSITLYVRLREDRIWVEEDWTEEGIGNYLRHAGVPSEDIVLAFQPEYMRPYVEYAA